MDAQILPVFLNGARAYVQGSQMIARAAEMLAAPHGFNVLESVAFKAATAQQVRCEPAVPLTGSERLVGVARFSDRSGEVLDLSFLETGCAAPRRDRGEQVAWRPVRGDRDVGEAVFDYENLASFEDMLDLIVQATKEMHLERDPAAFDVWFTGLRGGGLPLDPVGLVGCGRISIRRIREMRAGGRLQTLNIVELRRGDGIVTTMVSFAHQTKRPTHVA